MPYYSRPLCAYLFPGVGLRSSLQDFKQHRESMAGRGRKKDQQQPTGDAQETGEMVSDDRSLLEVFIASQSKRDEEATERALEARQEQLAAEARAKQAHLDAEERAEQRRIRAEIAAEEREEKRREREEERKEKAKIAEEERLEARALEKEKRKREEAMRVEEANEKREEAAKESARQMLEMQAEFGRKASEAHRREVERAKVISSLTVIQKDEDLEDYLLTQERKLKGGGILEDEWLALVGTKLTGGLGTSWQDLVDEGLDYWGVRTALLKGKGYTPSQAGDDFYAFKHEHLKGMAGEQVFKKGAQLLKRMVAPTILEKSTIFKIVKPWVLGCVGRRARAALEAREIADAEALGRGLQDFLSHEGEKVPGKVAVFGGEAPSVRRQTYHNEQGRERRKAGDAGSYGSSSSLKCFKCGKPGHKAADCWQGGAGKQAEGSGSSKIICFICGVEGHKATTCPNKREAQRGGSTKPVKRLKLAVAPDVFMDGQVNGRRASLLLDSGAHMTVVPEHMVDEECRTGECASVKGVLASGEMPVAKVTFEVKGMGKWEEKVGLAPAEKGKESEILYGLRLRTPRGQALLALALEQEGIEIGVKRVTTRADSKKEEAERQETAKLVEAERPSVKPVVPGDRKEVEAGGKPVEEPSPSSGKQEVGREKSTGDGKLVADRPASNPEPVAQLPEVVEVTEVPDSERSTGDGTLVADRPASNPEPVSPVAKVDSGVDVLSLEEEVEYCLREDEGLEDLEFPPVRKGPGDRAKLVDELKTDPSLKGWRRLAEKGEQGFLWERDLLFQAKMSEGGEVIHALVLPKGFRSRVLEMAHEGSGHLGARKVRSLLSQRFAWPGMGVDAIKHTRSCRVCQRCSKAGSRKVPMMERQVISEPFEVLAFDLVGPFPAAKYGYRYLLTAICMGSKWPEAIPLKVQTAKAVAAGMMEVFSRTGIPLQLLTDQGRQFVGALMDKLCRDLRIDKLQCAPYHPETNGAVERMHGTLGPMLTKASQMGLDWVEQIPFALFALRSAPNKDTGFSPYQLVYGHRVRTPLDVLHQGWAELEFGELETEEWSDWLVQRLEVWHDLVRERGKKASGERKALYDKSTVERTLEPGDQVMCRIPGLVGKLEESWHGPYKVVAKKGRVDYLVDMGKGKGRVKVLHINNLKKYYPRTEEVLRLALVAEDWSDDEEVGTKLQGKFEGFEEEMVVCQLKEEYPEVFSDLPGKTSACQLKIDTGEAAPRRSHPYRVPDRLKEGVRSEVNKLVELGIVVPSNSPWASPVVPVPKTDGTVRVCVDYRRLNEVTTADPYYMATMDEIVERVGKSRIMSKIDLAKGFYQVEVEASSQEKTAFVSPYGKYQFTRMPFGLKNAPAMFQRLMEVVLGDCYDFSAPYIDDVVVFSEDAEEHVQHLRSVLNALRKYGLTIKEEKCEWGRVRLEYLGHIIGGGELAVPAHRAAAMADYKQPQTKKQLRSFLGAASYYRQFVQGYAKLSSVLSPMTTKSAPCVVCWTVEGLEAFARLKVSLVDVCVLTVPTQQDNFVLHTDASGRGIGATLNVVRNGRKLPVAFYSKQLQGAQHHYSATELEGLAMFRAINYFAHYLYGTRFEVVTDHKALVSLLSSRVLNRRLHGWVLQLLEFDFSVVYRPGLENGDADALSRQAWDSRSGDPWMQQGEGVEEEPGLRPAPSLFVGGDVGTEPHRSKNRRAGVATSGVALQGPAEDEQQEAEEWPQSVWPSRKKQCARDGDGSVQKDGCKGGGVQALSPNT